MLKETGVCFRSLNSMQNMKKNLDETIAFTDFKCIILVVIPLLISTIIIVLS